MNAGELENLKKSGLLWQGGHNGRQAGRVEPSGWTTLDELIGGGWPCAGLSEILGHGQQGLSLVLPVLARLSGGTRWLAWIAPPHIPYAPTLAAAGIAMQRTLLVRDVGSEQGLWAAEQALKSAACAVVLLWPGRLEIAQLRRLQLAAEKGDCLGLLFRSLRDSGQSSPASLRLRVQSAPLGLDVEVLKRRGGWGGARCCIQVT